MENSMKEKYKQPEDLKEDLNVFLETVPNLELVVDRDLQADLPTLIISNEDEVEEKEEKKREQDKFVYQLDLLIDLLQTANTENVVDIVDQRYTEIRKIVETNQKTILDTIRSYEEVLRSINLFFKNAGGTVEEAFFITVDPQRFAGKKNSSHYDEMCDYLKTEFYAWNIENSPAFIGYVGDIEDGANDLASISEETVALSVVDVRKTSSTNSTIKMAKNRNLRGGITQWGHLAVSGTWLVGRDPYENIEIDPLYIPSAAAIIGKLMATDTGEHITGFDTAGLKGVKKVAYENNSDTRDSPKFREMGMLLLAEMNGGVYVIGDRTANTSGDDEYRKLSKMVVRNKVMKDLVAFCNLKTDSRLDDRLKREVTTYLNECKRLKVIKGYQNLKIEDINADEVDLTVELIYFDTKSKFNISIKGTRGELDIQEEKS